ncbi:MAG: hypothetical protein OHK0024_21910 [Thalassobaculales bacterium]
MRQALLRRAEGLTAYRISPADTNYMALLFAPGAGGTRFTAVVEIFQPGGRTPPNTHAAAEELFFVLKGEGLAHAGGKSVALKAGDALAVPPGVEHVIENTGTGKLYTLTVMAPNEEFAELLLAGTPVELDAEDRAVIGGGGR